MNVYFAYVDWTLEASPRVFYVGKGNLKRTQKRERNTYWKNIAAKHGWRREVLLATKDESFAFEEEKRHIAEFGTFEDGTLGRWGANLTEGGEGASGYKHTQETRQKLSEMREGKIPWNKGVTHSEETCLLISQKATGRKLPPRSEEHRAKMSVLRKGKTGESWCKPWTEEQREHASEIQKEIQNKPEVKQRKSVAARAVWERLEFRDKIVEAQRIAQNKPEVRERNAAAQRGKKRSEETRIKMSVAAKLREAHKRLQSESNLESDTCA